MGAASEAGPDLLARGGSIVGALIVIVGAYAAWGALSVVDEQAEIVQVTRHILAGLAGLAIVAASVPWLRRFAAINGVCAFLVISILAWSEAEYEKNQSFQYSVDAPTWGFAVMYVGAVIGLVACVSELVLIVRARAVRLP